MSTGKDSLFEATQRREEEQAEEEQRKKQRAQEDEDYANAYDQELELDLSGVQSEKSRAVPGTPAVPTFSMSIPTNPFANYLNTNTYGPLTQQQALKKAIQKTDKQRTQKRFGENVRKLKKHPKYSEKYEAAKDIGKMVSEAVVNIPYNPYPAYIQHRDYTQGRREAMADPNYLLYLRHIQELNDNIYDIANDKVGTSDYNELRTFLNDTKDGTEVKKLILEAFRIYNEKIHREVEYITEASIIKYLITVIIDPNNVGDYTDSSLTEADVREYIEDQTKEFGLSEEQARSIAENKADLVKANISYKNQKKREEEDRRKAEAQQLSSRSWWGGGSKTRKSKKTRKTKKSRKARKTRKSRKVRK